MCKVYTDVGGIKQLYRVCPPVRKLIHWLKLVDYKSYKFTSLFQLVSGLQHR